VTDTDPDTDATGVAIDSNVTITFSEAVTLAAGFASISCGSSGAHTYALDESADPVIVLNPDSDFSRGETCTVTITAASVTDDDTNDPPDAMASDYSWSFSVLDPDSAPFVTATDPDTDATGVAIDSNVTITFSEAVTLAAGFAAISCGTSGTHTYALDESSDPVIVLNPDSDFSRGETCTVTITASMVNDEDGTPTPMDADYSWSFTTLAPDAAPAVSAVTPLDGATGVAYASDLTVTFSEAVNVANGWYAISCASSGTHTAAVSGGPTDFTLNPDTDFASFEVCTVTLENTLVTDQDTDDPPDEMAADFIWNFTTAYDPDTILPIATARAHLGWTVTIQGNLTIEPHLFASRDSFYIQDSTGGIYIYPAYDYVAPDMNLGDVVTIKGTVKVYGGITEIDPVTSLVVEGSGTVPTPEVTVTNPNVLKNTQGKLIQVEGTIRAPNTPPAPGAAHYTLYIDDGSGEVTVYVYKLTNIDMRGYTTGTRMRIIGISTAYNTTPEIQPRYQYDVIDLTPPTVTGTVPNSGATDVSPHKPITATFSKSMALSSLTGNFTLTGPGGAVSGVVSYTEATKTAMFTPAAHLDAGTSYTAELNTSVEDIYGVNLETSYSWSFTTGDLDTTAPTIETRSPLPDAEDVAVSTPITVTFSEDLAPSSLDTDHFVLTSPYGDVGVTFEYDPVTYTATLTPNVSLLYSTLYTMKVTADTADYAGNQLGADDIWSFTTMAEPPMQVFLGDLHNHTSNSDGSGTPTEALIAGEAAGFDFMAITDHSYAYDDTEWANTLTAVETATDADFVALRGFEYTQGAEGHINVYNSDRHACRADTGATKCDYTPNLESGSTVQGFYAWMVDPSKNMALDSSGLVMQFNHPGWINFNDWFYHPEINALAPLEEVGNGYSSSYVFSEEEFIRSLDYGWKSGATNNSDTHSDQWGTNTDHRTGVVMPELTKTALLEALRARRTYASEDKNFELTMKANGQWMGSEISNSGTIQFVITGMDPDGELAAVAELITDQGVVIASIEANSANFSWSAELTDVAPGVHYYYAKITQYDGDRIVSSPVWTIGSEDISITDLAIQPTIPTTHNPSLFTVRVTNRVDAIRAVNVILRVDGVQQGSAIPVTVPANGDGYANFSWQPTSTGGMTVSAEIETAPVGDNPDDNSAHLHLTVTDELLPLILIDATHGNMNTAGNEMRSYVDDLSAHGYNVLKNLNPLTDAVLDNDVVKLLIIAAPSIAYTDAEQTAIANFVNDGGSLWMGGISDYDDTNVADRENAILDKIETLTGADSINMRMNDDELLDANDNNGYVWGVWWDDFPSADTTGIGMNIESISTWSLSSIVDGNKQALTADDTGVSIIMQGDLDVGCTSDSFHNPYRTANIDAVPSGGGAADGDGYIYNSGWDCDLTSPPAGAVPVPGAAVVDIAGTPGRIMLYGDSNDPFTIFAYTAGDGKQNELFNLESVMWLLGEPIQKSTIAEARAQAAEDVPDNLDKVVWIEGEITAAYGEFFNVLYVQDATGGITVHAPSGDIDPSAFTRGTHVRAIGTVGIYNGDTELEFFEAEQVQVITGDGYNATPLSLTTAQASQEANEGWLAVLTGTVVGKSGTDTLYIDDGSGQMRIFLDGYNGVFTDIHMNDIIQVTGLVSEDGSGARIRVRNYKLHTGLPDDVVILEEAKVFYFPIAYQ
jgi:uncharacterized protein YdeI (BOF family)